MQAAVAYPDRFRASASLHGTSLISDNPESPHLGVAKLRGELYCGFAEFDHYAPLPMVAQLGDLLKPCQVKYTQAIHEGARSVEAWAHFAHAAMRADGVALPASEVLKQVLLFEAGLPALDALGLVDLGATAAAG